MSKKIVCLVSVFMSMAFVLSMMPVVMAQVQPTSRLIPFEGVIPGQADGPVALRFRAFPTAQGGTACFQETQTVIVSEEAFTAFVGDGTTGGFPATPCFSTNASVWIAFAFETAPDQELGDRAAITSGGYAHAAQWASNAQMANNAQAAVNAQIAQNALTANRATSAQIADTLILGATMSGSRSGPILNVVNTSRAGAEAGESGDGADGPPPGPGSVGISGVSAFCGNGVEGKSECGRGVYGFSSSGYGVYGQTNTSNNNVSGVLGEATATRGATRGVLGRTLSSTNGATGVVGLANANTGNTAGVYGQTNSSTDNATGVVGLAAANTGATNGVLGWTNSSTNTATGVYGVAGASTGNTVGVWGDTNSSTNGATGVFGRATANSGQTTGVFGVSNSTHPASAGVFGQSGNDGVVGRVGQGTNINLNICFHPQLGAIRCSIGVRGDGPGTAFRSVGVLGSGMVGVRGESVAIDSPVGPASGFGTGVFGRGIQGVLGQGGSTGVKGEVDCVSPCAGVVAINTTPPGLFRLGLRVEGNSIVSGGFKSAAIRLQGQEHVLLYSEESTEVWFSDYGSVQLADGLATVQIDPEFLQTVNTNKEYHVFLTANGNPIGALYIDNKTPTSFEIRETSGSADIKVSYRIVAKRKDFADERLRKMMLPDVKRSEPKQEAEPKQESEPKQEAIDRR